MAPTGMRAPIQLASVSLMLETSQSLPHSLSWMAGRAGDVQPRAVPRTKAPRVAGKEVRGIK